MSFQMLNDYEHVLQKIPMYAGSEKYITSAAYLLEGDSIIKKEIDIVPAILKLISELIDNSVDEYIRTSGKYANKIDIAISGNIVNVKDNGRGIPVKEVQTYKGVDWQPKLSWTELKAGTNFGKDDSTTIGTFGVGSSLCSVLSKKFIGISDDGENKCTVTCTDNNSNIDVKISKSTNRGCNVTMYIDMERFANGELSDINDTHIYMVKQRLINLSLTYPGISFSLNKQKIKIDEKKFLNYFGVGVNEITANTTIGIFTSETDDFQQFSLINGLTISDGGNHIDYIMDNIITGIREKLIKKYKTIKPGDIRNKLKLVLIMKNFNRPEYNSQTKEKLTNDKKDIAEYFKELDIQKLVNKILRTPEIIDPITEVYKIKEELKKRQELKGLDKTVKKIKSDKYLPSIGVKKYLLLIEGESAFGGLSPVLGRKECGYYILKGKPLNAYSASQSKFVANKELSELYKIVQNENYNYIVYATDQDLDGFHIRGLLTGFFVKYLPEWKGKIGMLQTPVIGITKKNKLHRWVYSLNEDIKLSSGEVSNYYKGLGSWDIEDLKYVVQQDGIQKMVEIIDFDNEQIIEDWLGDDSEPRKKYILENDFSITKL